MQVRYVIYSDCRIKRKDNKTDFFTERMLSMNKRTLFGIGAVVLALIYAASPDFVPGPVDDMIVLIVSAIVSGRSFRQERIETKSDQEELS